MASQNTCLDHHLQLWCCAVSSRARFALTKPHGSHRLTSYDRDTSPDVYGRFLERLAAHLSLAEPKVHLYRAVSAGEADGCGALSRRASPQYQPGNRRNTVYSLQPLRPRLSRESDRRRLAARRCHATQSLDDIYLRHLPLHVLRAL